ncbi:Beta-1,3-galactosyltransferase 1 [Holothuria leucospilota]|uniref:Hexosyltransferase n=1 Tax=Holothuria leucospilota TaxID=206669 RepID=A0A9Q1H947_HOLLE|nr:Beta-1,3-galactosyltransferase 1 [Holothuria leucospilota]
MHFNRAIFLLSGLHLLYFIGTYSVDLILRKYPTNKASDFKFRKYSEQVEENRSSLNKVSEGDKKKTNTFSEINGLPNATRRLQVNSHKYELLLNEPDVCRTISGKIEPIFLLVLMISSSENFEQRIRQRKSCLSIQNVSGKRVKSVFLLGNPGNKTIKDLIYKESAKYHDILMENFYDSYRNLTLKTIMGLKWASIYCPAAAYVMKTDDDVFINLTSAATYFEEIPSKSVMSGFLWPNSKPYRVRTSKWYLSRKEYSKDRFPKYLSGMCYVLSGDLPRRLFEESLSVPYLFLEDVYIGLLSERLHVSKLHSSKFLIQKTAYNFCTFRDAIAVHLYHPALVDTYWEKQLKMSISNSTCSQERK